MLVWNQLWQLLDELGYRSMQLLWFVLSLDYDNELLVVLCSGLRSQILVHNRLHLLVENPAGLHALLFPSTGLPLSGHVDFEDSQAF